MKKQGVKRRRKRRLSAFAYGLIFFVIATAAITVIISIYFKIKVIKVEGNSIYNAKQVTDASKIKLGSNLFSVDSAKTNEAVCKSLPYIKKVEVIKQPLSTILIKVTPDKACKIFAVSDGYLLIDSDGKVLEKKKDLTGCDGLSVYTGLKLTKSQNGEKIKADVAQINTIENISGAIEKNKFESITGIDVTNILSITLKYDNRITIIIGTESDIQRKLQMAKQVIANNISKTERVSLDVSVVGHAYIDPQ